MLRSGHATVFGGTTIESGFAVRMLHGAFSVVAVVGCPPGGAIAAALEGTTGMTPLLTQRDNADYVERAIVSGGTRPEGDWRRERVIVHAHGSFPVVTPPDRDVAIRLLSEDDALDHLPAGLRFEMMHAREVAPVAGAFVDLQEERHTADYDNHEQWSATDVEETLNITRSAFQNWQSIRTDPMAGNYLLAMLLSKQRS